jgi:hypothetical protein
VNDASFTPQISNNALAPLVVRNVIKALSPTTAYELCSAVRAALQARNQPFSQVQCRLFLKSSGQEILGGDLYQKLSFPNKFQAFNVFLTELAYWDDLAGERAILLHDDKEKDAQMHILNPFGLTVYLPARPRLPEDIKKWWYIWQNGDLETLDNEAVYFDHPFNPSSPVRGASPLIAVINSITASYQAQKYIRSYFGNNARPDMIVNVDTDNPSEVVPFKEEFNSRHRGEENAWTAFFTYGKKLSIEELSQPIAEAPFQELVKNVTAEVMSLYMVPPLHGGQWDKTRFDSVEEQNNWFYESTWMPRLENNQRFIQGLVDNKLQSLSIERYRKANLSKSMDMQFEKLRGTTKGDIVVLLDTEQVPAVARLKINRLKYAKEIMDTAKVSPRNACIEVGLHDLEFTPASDLVWFNSDAKFIEQRKDTSTLVTPMDVAVEQTEVTPAQEEEVVESIATEQEIDQAHKIKLFYRELRKLTLELKDKQSIWTLNQVDTLSKKMDAYSVTLSLELRKDYHYLRSMKDSDSVKKYFNGKKNSFYRKIAMTK